MSQKQKRIKNKIGYGKYSSRLKRVNVPIPSFEYVHKSWFSKHRQAVSPGFMIGRDRIIEKLKTWLTKEKSNGGSYLITGYRGMGKTCFVDRVLYELVGEPCFWTNLFGLFIFLCIGIGLYILVGQVKDEGWNSIPTESWNLDLCGLYLAIGGVFLLWCIRKQFYLREKMKKYAYRIAVGLRFVHRHKKMYDLWGFLKIMKLMWTGMTAKEWDRINNLVYSANVKNKRYSQICISVNLGQEILDERSILCVLTSQLYHKYRSYVLSPIANVEMWLIYTVVLVLSFSFCPNFGCSNFFEILPFIENVSHSILIVILPFGLFAWHQLRILTSLHILRRRIDAEMKSSEGMRVKYDKTEFGNKMEYSYPVAEMRDIESQLITILDRIEHFPIHPTFYFVFDELDKIETPMQQSDDSLPEYSGEKYLPTGGTSRRRKFMVMHLLANMKYFTSTAKAKFIFIAGREMYDGYLADLTDRESAISSLFNGVIYVESFCKNEKSDKDVIYNTETFIARQLLPRKFIADKVMDRFVECKIKNEIYTNIDINLKLYFEYLTLVYTDNLLKSSLPDTERLRYFNAARACIDKTVGLLYHFAFYLYHVSNGSPKKMRMNFENRIRPLRNKKEFLLTRKRIQYSPLEGMDLDIYIPEKCDYLLSFGEREQRVIGFIHYISFPVNQIITDANQFGDKLLVSACFLINHLYKHHSGGFSWRNIEQTPELLEVYKIPEFRGFINSILSYLLQTHIIQIPCGLYQFKFRKRISEEISLASKVSEEVSAIFNFTLDESQSVKRHYLEVQKKHLLVLKEEGASSPHSVAGIHHILGDLYLADEEYNQAILEYQTALKILDGIETDNNNPHQATLTLAYIRNMLKLGIAFEKRRTYTSAYNTYNEIIDRLIRFREFDESQFGLEYVTKRTNEWPYHDALLYNEGLKAQINKTGEKRNEPIRKVIPLQISENKTFNRLIYKTKGNRMISDFSHQMTPDKHTVIQRLAMLEDTQLVYQALLAKLFINEKIELGGITRTNLDVIEGEYQYLHLTVNEKEKFLISTDFFRRLGDIMFYKNGLIGQGYTCSETSGELKESVIDSLYYWAFNIKTELRDYCNEHRCHELYGDLLDSVRKLDMSTLNAIQQCGEWQNSYPEKKDELREHLKVFWEQRIVRLKKLPLKDVKACNETRMEMWAKKHTMPCYACKYYNRSLRIIMQNLFGMDAEDVQSGEKKESKTIRILRVIVLNGSAKSMRQNHMIQFAEVLDCLGNTTLGCSDFQKNKITSKFLSKFLYDVRIMNRKMDERMYVKDFKLLISPPEELSKLERSILYFWEAYICFRYGREQKKAFGSLKKILRLFQNYLRVAEKSSDEKIRVQSKVCIGEFLNEIKNRLIKQSLICLYAHYNFINMVEIQQLKWIFYAQMYENISLNRLSLFPDVEEVMLIYYEIIRLCIIDEDQYEIADRELAEIRVNIEAYSRDFMSQIGYTWNNVKERNVDFNERLIGVYNNLSMGSLRHESTVYERILSLRLKVILNRHILFIAFPDLKSLWYNSRCKDKTFADVFLDILTEIGTSTGNDEEWKRFFPDEDFCDEGTDTYRLIHDRLHLLEFLIRDSIYCLTSILETITPYTTTTLFTNSFMGSVYRMLNKWNILFDSLFLYYKFFDERNPKPEINKESYWEIEENFKWYDNAVRQECQSSCNSFRHRYNCHNDSGLWQSECPYYNIAECKEKTNRFEKSKRPLFARLNEKEMDKIADTYRKIWHCHNLSDRFFGSILYAIDKHNIQNTLTNYSGEMALNSYRKAKEVHREGRAYKDMISRIYCLDDDLKNDTVQFDLAVERFKINSEYIDNRIQEVLSFLTDSIYDLENFCADKETRVTLQNRFPDMFWNIGKDEVSACVD